MSNEIKFILSSLFTFMKLSCLAIPFRFVLRDQ